ncbi:HAMP domain-containing protein, partial [Metapseudomonas otitidis]
EIGKVRLGVSTASVEAQLKALDSRFSALIASSGDLVAQSLAGAASGSTAVLTARLKSAQDAASSMSTGTQSTVEGAAHELRWRIGLALVLVGLGVLLVLAVVLGHRVVNRLRLLISALNDLAAGEGDLTRRVQIDSRDEVGEMAGAVNRFIDKLQPIVREAGEVAVRTGSEIRSLAERSRAAEAAADRQRNEVAGSLEALGQMAAEAQAESHAMQTALQQVGEIRQATQDSAAIARKVGGLIETLEERVQNGSEVIERLARQSEQIEVVLS